MIYRIKQFLWAITTVITPEEKNFVIQYLSPQEKALFQQLKPYEQKHCIKVAMALEQLNGREEVDNYTLVRLGLLHDIGKIKFPIGPIRKSIMVLLDKITKGSVSKYTHINMIKCYYEHPQLGYEILKKIGGYDKVFLENIKSHHLSNTDSDLNSLKLLKYYDDKY